MLTEGTTHAIAVIESVDPARHADLAAALALLAERIGDRMGATIAAQAILTRDTPSVSLAGAPA